MNTPVPTPPTVMTAESGVARNERDAMLAAIAAHADSLPEDDRLAVAVKVFRAVLDQARHGGTFRHLIYDRLGFSPEAYLPLHYAGGQHISEGFVLTDHLGEESPAVLVALEALAKAAPMQPHPTLKRVDGTPIPEPTPERSQLFSAVAFMEHLLESNRMLMEANKRLSAQNEELERKLEQGVVAPDDGH